MWVIARSCALIRSQKFSVEVTPEKKGGRASTCWTSQTTSLVLKASELGPHEKFTWNSSPSPPGDLRQGVSAEGGRVWDALSWVWSGPKWYQVRTTCPFLFEIHVHFAQVRRSDLSEDGGRTQVQLEVVRGGVQEDHRHQRPVQGRERNWMAGNENISFALIRLKWKSNL